MTALVKAQLCEISGDPGSTQVGDPIDVQFNPATLHVAINNKTTGGSQAGSQAKQKPGTGEVTVNFDLFFDTSDEGTTEEPIPVTRRTQIVEKFVRPRGNTPALQSPPRVRFKWGTFLVEGVMDSANIDLDLFSPNGTPLRAKVAVSIKGQDPSYRYDPLPPSAPAAPGTPGLGFGQAPSGTAALPPGTPGTVGNSGPPASVTEALPGESLAQLAARVGLDPGAWRALAAGIPDPASLAPGQEVALPATMQASGVGAGVGSNAPAVVAAASLPGTPSAPPPAPAFRAAPNPVLAGQALARRGGVRGTIDGTKRDAGQAAAAATIAAFGLTPAAPGGGSRPYGGGIPMRPLIGGTGSAPVTPDPTIPGWQAVRQRVVPSVRALNSTRPGCSGPPARRG